MKRALFFTLSMVTALSMFGCGQPTKRGTEPVVTRGGEGRSPDQPLQNGTIGGGTGGVGGNTIGGSALEYSAGRGVYFMSEQAVKDLLSANVNPQKVGHMNCANCAVGMWLKVAGDKSLATMSNNETINENSTSANTHLRLVVWDDLVGQPDGSGGTYQPMQIDIPSPADSSSKVTGTITNKTDINLTFQDKFGSVQVIAKIMGNSTVEVSSVKFQNLPNSFVPGGISGSLADKGGSSVLYPRGFDVGVSVPR